jgi:hypothetical protein
MPDNATNPTPTGAFTCGAFTPEGEFLELPEFDMERLLVDWQDAVFELYLAEEKIAWHLRRW